MTTMPAKDAPNSCSVFEKRLSRYADGDLGPHEGEESRLHVEACPKCAARLEAHRRMILLLESTKEVEAPWDLDLKVLEAIGFGGARTQLRGHSVSPAVVWAAGVAAMILVGAGGLVLRSGVARVLSILFGPSGILSTQEMAGLASKITRYLVTVWDGLAAGIGTLHTLLRSMGAITDAAWGNPLAMGTVAGTAALVFLFIRIMAQGKRSRAVSKGRRSHVDSSH
jgi:hypothetical protein